MLKTIIVDDEPPALIKMEKLLSNHSSVIVEDKFTQALDALDYLKTHSVDAVFLDIEMPDMDGIELASHIIDLQGNAAIIFVTACNQYAVEAFRLNALDYLLKPVSPDRLRETIDRIIENRKTIAPVGKMKIRCFGKFEVIAGEEEVKFRTEKAQELLAFLIESKGSYISRSKIIDSLWEDFEGDKAIINFNTTLHYVKKALLPYGIKINIMYDAGNYRINLEEIKCDYLQFSEFVQNKTTVNKNNILKHTEAADLYSGEYLSGWEAGWAAGKRLQLEEDYLRLLLTISKYYIETGESENAAKWLKAGLQQEPLHRELNYLLIKTLSRMKEQIAAMKYYELYANGLKKKLDMEPDDAFRKLLR